LGLGDFSVRLTAAIGLGFGLLGTIAAANAADCPGNPGAMGTSRVLKIDPREYPLIGTVQYQETLPLNDKEVVLTFDDGPMPPYTNRVLETLAHECVKANYFIVGRMARGYPDLLRRIHAEGHVIGTHSENHPLAFEKMPLGAVQAEIDQGFASTRNALRNADAVAPFFRIPGLLRADTVEKYLRSRGMATWSADVVADDWKHITASEVVNRSIARLDARGKGILLLHDIQPATALALPHLLRELKRRGYKIVQVAPASAPLVASAPHQPSAVAAPTVTTTVVPKQQPQPQTQVQPQRETSTWPVPYPARTPAPAVTTQPVTSPAAAQPQTVVVRPGPVTETRAVTQAVPQQAPAPEPVEIPPEAAVANASPVPAAPPAEPEPPAQPSPLTRTMPVPILEAVRSVPLNADPAPEPQPNPQQVSRPLTSGFKPSHSDAPPMKVTEIPVERQQADPWAMRAEIKPR
jgi:peptidoglycan/xylan/chitin deacetylase (PgdA/CDA1 family)